MSRWWLALVAGAALGMALWLRTMSVPYLTLSALATALALAGARLGRARGWALAGASLLALSAVVGGVYERSISEIDHDWERYSRDVAEAGLVALRTAVNHDVEALRGIARRALDAPRDRTAAFSTLERLFDRDPWPHGGIVLWRDTARIAWAGETRVVAEDVADSIAIVENPFYISLAVTARGDARRTVATSVLHAEPPGDRLTRSVDAAVVRSSGLRGFEYREGSWADSGWSVLTGGGRDLISVRPVSLSRGEARVRVIERARLAGGAGLGLTVLVLMGVAWWRPASLGQRLAALAVGLAATAIVPFNAYSNASRIFDPAAYFTPLGGPLTANVGALAVTGALVLLGCLALVRAGVRSRSRWLAALVVAGVASSGPFLLRDLARGVTLPPHGAPAVLWLAWQIALFLAASAMLLIGASAGRLAMAGRRGLPPALAPAIAIVAVGAAPLLWQPPGRWPGWYPVLWIAAMAALALARRSRGLVLNVGIAAACGAVTLAWGAVSRDRVELAQLDVSQLAAPDSSNVELLDRFGDALEASLPPLDRADLLLRYVRSPLEAAGHPIGMAVWLPGEEHPHAELLISDFEHHPESERALVARARAAGVRTWDLDRSTLGVQTLMAVPYPDSIVVTVVIAPRTRLIPEDPFTSLIGLAPVATTEPPYDLTLTTLPSPLPLSEHPSWIRVDNELHGDWRVPRTDGTSRVHVEVDLRGLDVLLPRGALIVLLDLVILSGLWTLVALADGGFLRWVWYRARRWTRSYRGRLTVTLFAFFVIPAAAFALWSYRRLQLTDLDARILLVRESLRSITAGGEGAALDSLSDRFDTPLFEYRAGALSAVSDGLYALLAPVGRYLPPSVAINLGVESELTATARPLVAGIPTLFGYRPVMTATGERAVLAVPARTNERALDRERRDIGMLVLFATSLGALAALGLSGLAARELERPVGALRRAALRIARGERYVRPGAPPALEFGPVFSAFERMDAELAAGREALEEAQRRTAAVLRDVGSGVVATDRDGIITIANPPAERMLGRAISAGVSLAAAAPELAGRTRPFLAGSNESEVFDLELGGRQLRGSLTRLAWGGGGAVLTLDDVTDLARAQRVLAWGEMARQVAHEIKNPLTPMRLGVQHLRRARHDRRVDFDQVLEQNASRILAEIDRLDEIARAFSRYGMAGAERDAPERVDVAAVARDVVELERMGVSEVRWHLDGADAPVPAMARRAELRDVLLNLLENARQAHARNITVGVEPRDGRVQMVVADDGDGIPTEHLARVFEPHFSTRTSGSGLGLAISRALVTSWGGEMQARSGEGRGTEMRITLLAAEGS